MICKEKMLRENPHQPVPRTCPTCGIFSCRYPENASGSSTVGKLSAQRQEIDQTYTEGVCEDGAAILKDGVMMKITDILAELNDYAAIKARDAELREAIERGFDDLPAVDGACDWADVANLRNALLRIANGEA